MMRSFLNEQLSKLKVYLLFYRSTLRINCSVSFLFAFVILIDQADTSIIDWIKTYFNLFCSIGLLCDLLYKEMARKEEYYFYYNCSASKLKLIIVSFIFSLFIYLIISQCLNLIM